MFQVRRENPIGLQFLQHLQSPGNLRLRHSGFLRHFLSRYCKKTVIIQTVCHKLCQFPAACSIRQLLQNIVFDTFCLRHWNIFSSPVFFLRSIVVILFQHWRLFIGLPDILPAARHRMLLRVIQERIFQVFVLQKFTQFHTVHGQHLQGLYLILR